jgi:pseudaminic acid biosynthesis-associated methylase
MKQDRTEQEVFWSEQYAGDYIDKNNEFDFKKGEQAWRKMLDKAPQISNILECGCNIGRNINSLNEILPDSKKSIIEISNNAYSVVTNKYQLNHAFNGSILESNFPEKSFDLVFTMGVLIHIAPEKLLQNLEKICNYSSKYILIGEYFSRDPVMLNYQGEEDKLYKRDFGKMLIENFPLKIVDYGFLWGYEYDAAGFDDITWWLFEKK